MAVGGQDEGSGDAGSAVVKDSSRHALALYLRVCASSETPAAFVHRLSLPRQLVCARVLLLLCCSRSQKQVSRGDVEVLVDTFPGQSIDFFGALRARVYDDKVCAQAGRDSSRRCYKLLQGAARETY